VEDDLNPAAMVNFEPMLNNRVALISSEKKGSTF
jgi:hypothetical protein